VSFCSRLIRLFRDYFTTKNSKHLDAQDVYACWPRNAVQILGIWGSLTWECPREDGWVQKDFNGRWDLVTLFYSKYNHSRWYLSVECQDCCDRDWSLDLSFRNGSIFLFLEGFKFYLLLFTHRLIASNRPRVSKIIVTSIATLFRHVSYYVIACSASCIVNQTK